MALRVIGGGRSASIPFTLFDSVLDRSCRRQIGSLMDVVDLERGQTLAREGEVGREFLIVAEGMVQLWTALSGDRRQIVAFRGPGDVVSLHRHDTPWPSTAEAVRASKIFSIEWDALRRLANRRPAIHQALLDLASDEITSLQNHILTLGRKTSEEKLASFILECCRPASSFSGLCREVDLPMRRCEIAQYLGLTTESVSREFSRFKKRRIISAPRPSRIVVLNRPALEAIATGKRHRGERTA